MKNQNTAFAAMVFALAFGIAAVTEAVPSPGGGPTTGPANYQPSAEGEQLPVITIRSAGDIPPGKDRLIRPRYEACNPVRGNVRKLQGQWHRCRGG